MLNQKKKEFIDELNSRVEDKILNKANAEFLAKLISKADSLEEVQAIMAMGTTYKRTGFHFDFRKEPACSNIKYLKKNEKLSFVTDKDALTHKLIIGDNYDALRQLLITHRGLVDVIYIDPPYGKNDMGDFAGTNYTNGITRDNLLSMLYVRLQLAKDLLSDTGVIYCSIDDKNQAYVKCIMDEIFGEGNFIACMPRSTSSGEKTSKFNINTNSDYVLFYCRNVESIVSNGVISGVSKDFKEYTNPDNDPNGPWKKDSLLIKIDSGRYGYARYGITNPLTNVTYYPPVYYNEKDRKQWHYIEETFEQKKKEGKVVFLEEEPKTGYGFFIKKYLSEVTKDTSNLPSTCLIDKEYQNANGTKMLKSIFKESPFAYSKPVSLIKKLVSIINNPNAIVLDFFAGSGTTGQAVLELNREDGGNRKFIVCTNNEKTESTPNGIAYDVTAKRLKRVMTGSCYNGNTDFDWVTKNEPYGDNLEVTEIAEISPTIADKGNTPFDVIDESLYDILPFDKKEDKINWICTYFKNTMKGIESDKKYCERWGE